MEIQSDLIKCEAEEKIGKESYSWALEYCERCESFILAACFIVLVQNKRQNKMHISCVLASILMAVSGFYKMQFCIIHLKVRPE